MQIQPNDDFGVSVRFSHRCGHVGEPLFFAGEEFATLDRAYEESNPCLRCHQDIELHLIKDAQEQARVRRVNPQGSSFPVPPENDDPALPRKGDFYIDESTIVRVERQNDGSYWLRRVPCNGIAYQTWVRDQQALVEFFAERNFRLLRRDLH